MGARARIEPAALEVEPGTPATATLTIRNTGTVVDELRLSAVGGDGWVHFDRDHVSLFPGAEEAVTVHVAPPREPTTTAGRRVVGLRVDAKEDPAGTDVAELQVDILAFTDAGAELAPRTSTGRRRARAQMGVVNHGNHPLLATVQGHDPDQALTISCGPERVELAPGTAAVVKVVAAPVKRFWRGPDRTVPYAVVVAGEDGTPLATADGAVVQQALLPRWAPKAAIAALAALIALALLWFGMVRPAAESAAIDAAEEVAAEEAAAAVEAPLQQAQERLENLEEEIGVAEPTPTLGSTPFAARLSVSTSSPRAAYDALTENQELVITDIVVQNAGADFGTVFVERGDTTMLVDRLEFFRDLDFHFASPLVFTKDRPLVFRVQCARSDGVECSPAVFLVGELREVAPPSN